MTLATLLALGSSLGWGCSDFLGGLKTRALGIRSVLLVSQTVSLVVLVAAAVILRVHPPSRSGVIAAVLAGAGEVVGVAALYRGLAVGSASVVAPASSAAPVVPLAVGLFQGLSLTWLREVAIALVIAGVVTTAAEPPDPARPPGRASPIGQGVATSVGHGLVSAAGFGAYYVAMSAASHTGVPGALLIARATAVAAIAVTALTRRPHSVDVRVGDVPVLALIGFLIVAADGLYATATTLGQLNLVAVLAALHPVVTVALASRLTHDRLGPRRRFGVTLAIIGIAGLTWR